MDKSICSKCNKLFFYDYNLVPYRATDDNVAGLTLYEKIMTCPYCDTSFILHSYYKEWD